MRLPYVPDPPNFTNEDDKAVEQRVRKRRGEKGLIALDRTLLHAPPVADGWNSFLGAIRTGTSLPTSVRETAICRVAVLNKAWYEWDSHSPLLNSSPEITPTHTSTILTHVPHTPPPAQTLGPKLSAVLAYTDAMTLDVTVPEEVFTALKEQFSEKEVVEITATVAAYNCVSRFLVALDVGERNAQEGPGEGGKE
ncbi:4-carboxymuconolactone decarboxylase [Pyrenophora tritici-repentis]|uniref:4-carboxymuconolactone decarboxylase n=2 Tax=Pyrenophora tritici-repentis TaxID=45151 RepID=A0A2W1DI83_9PLEO|nr:4-carboxymuconolactone decarboxylase [Pyrenophora tritici-repentis]KAI1514421.1 4-carboxymuconolactone decarboxylase [Pyrenophora tritici-repentis]KAI1547568.1 4-carboxymuconolactone decarboxylase [Pyrenophora tritici-repentis]KAI1551723.1 4-carboxymuconolactone decarboxylase [Pyrenophora tritici-repentis]KAI1557660.1 4-carboxymuconolactone decarboxylase [Pyrenophora tritici-repentis]